MVKRFILFPSPLGLEDSIPMAKSCSEVETQAPIVVNVMNGATATVKTHLRLGMSPHGQVDPSSRTHNSHREWLCPFLHNHHSDLVDPPPAKNSSSSSWSVTAQ
ncbi:hypothetical protein TanjilG_17790 [Lupinus angustifolius]|uniref:Uncharacterized protein n=1 Tax=Lupinus angustifolius TaxID=3871 RepID=A0A4P1RTT7_LUPAN|nr:hypothetical protein TanjilG_17790 [Lupinus angustifolius]